MQKCRGFTLVELMVAVTISAVLLALSVARFRDFNRAQVVKEAAKTLVSDLRMAQSKALSGVKPDLCAAPARLVGYGVQFLPGSSYRTYADCDDGTSEVDKVVSLPQGVGITTEVNPFTFRILGLGADLGEVAGVPRDTNTITVSKGSTSVQVVVTKEGEIR